MTDNELNDLYDRLVPHPRRWRSMLGVFFLIMVWILPFTQMIYKVYDAADKPWPPASVKHWVKEDVFTGEEMVPFQFVTRNGKRQWHVLSNGTLIIDSPEMKAYICAEEFENE